MDSGGLYISVDIAMIVAALAPTLAILVTAWLQARARARDRAKLEGIHTLVNDQMTREKQARLDDLMTQKVVLERVLGNDVSEADMEMLSQMERRIDQLAREVQKRDWTAEHVTFKEGS